MAKRKLFNRKRPKKVVPTEKAPEVEALAADLIQRYHPGLRSAVVKYGFTAKKSKVFGKVVLVREEAQTLLERKVAFMLVVNKAIWDRYDEGRREAAVDELLCSMSYDGMQARVEKPDFKGYRANILRFGVRTEDLEHAFRGCQLILPGIEDIELELAPPEKCDDCGDPADKDMLHDGKALCPVCYRWRQESADPGRSNADDEGAHCEGCGSWGREGRLIEQPDGRLLCWRCVDGGVGEQSFAAGAEGVAMAHALNKLREGMGAGTSVTLSFGDQSVTMDGAAFDRATGRLSQMSDDELRELTGGHDEPGADQDPQGEAA